MEGISARQFVLGLAQHLECLCQFLQRPIQDSRRMHEEEPDDAHAETESFQNDLISLNCSITESNTQKQEEELRNSPKKPISSFVFYFREQLQRRDHPSNEKEVGKLAKIVSQEWKNLPPEVKQPYNIKAQESKRAYQDNIRGLPVENADESAQKLKIITDSLKQKKEGKGNNIIKMRKKYKKHKPKGPEIDIGIKKPKIPLSSFFIFFKENGPRISQSHSENRRSRLVQLASDEWKLLSREEKQRYETIARVNKEAYEKELQQYTTCANNYKDKLPNQPQTANPPKIEPKIKQLDRIAQALPLKSEISESDSELVKKQPDSLGEEFNSMSSSSSLCEQDLSSSSSYIEESTTKPTPKSEVIVLQKQQQSRRKIKRGKRSKEIHQPKGPVSSFFLYYNCVVRELKKEFPELKGSELVKIASTRWALFPEEEKEIYQQEAKRGRELYDIEMIKFMKEYPEEASKLKYFQTKREK